DADDGEADDVGGQRGPAIAELMGEVAVVARLGDGEDQQRDRDREDAVAEGLHPPLAHRRPRRLPRPPAGTSRPPAARTPAGYPRTSRSTGEPVRRCRPPAPGRVPPTW